MKFKEIVDEISKLLENRYGICHIMLQLEWRE